MTVLSWQGRHGPCVVGPTYAQGDRRDLAEMILRQFEHESWCRLRNPENTAECDCGVPFRDALYGGSGA